MGVPVSPGPHIVTDAVHNVQLIQAGEPVQFLMTFVTLCVSYQIVNYTDSSAQKRLVSATGSNATVAPSAKISRG